MRFFLLILFSQLSFAAPPVTTPVSPQPVYITSPSVQPGNVSVFVSDITLGDIWLLILILGLVQCALLGLIHGHQR